MKKIKEYWQEIMCRLGFHYYGAWQNGSYFYDSGIGFRFGWIGCYERRCMKCFHRTRKTPFLKTERLRLIKEKAEENK